MRQPILREPKIARHLRDDFVGAAIEVKAVDVIAAEQRRQRAADIGHVDAKAVRLRGVNLEFDLRRVEFEIHVSEDEQAALPRFLLHLVDDIGKRLVIPGRADDELHRRAAGIAGQRRRRERKNRAAGNLGELRRQILHHRFLIARALIPRLQEHAGEGLVNAGIAVDDEEVTCLGELLRLLIELVRRLLDIIEIAGLRRLDHREENALVLFRRELARRRHVHDAGERQDAGEHEHGHGAEVQRPMQPALIAPAEPIEHAVEKADKAATLVGGRLQQLRAHHRR